MSVVTEGFPGMNSKILPFKEEFLRNDEFKPDVLSKQRFGDIFYRDI